MMVTDSQVQKLKDEISNTVSMSTSLRFSLCDYALSSDSVTNNVPLVSNIPNRWCSKTKS